MFAKRKFGKNKNAMKRTKLELKKDSKVQYKGNIKYNKRETFKFKCHRCRKIRHKASKCTSRYSDNTNVADDVSLCAIADLLFVDESRNAEAFRAGNEESGEIWCVDSARRICAIANTSSRTCVNPPSVK